MKKLYALTTSISTQLSELETKGCSLQELEAFEKT